MMRKEVEEERRKRKFCDRLAGDSHFRIVEFCHLGIVESNRRTRLRCLYFQID
jgi:hypothetical protein